MFLIHHFGFSPASFLKLRLVFPSWCPSCSCPLFIFSLCGPQCCVLFAPVSFVGRCFGLLLLLFYQLCISLAALPSPFLPPSPLPLVWISCLSECKLVPRPPLLYNRIAFCAYSIYLLPFTKKTKNHTINLCQLYSFVDTSIYTCLFDADYIKIKSLVIIVTLLAR